MRWRFSFSSFSSFPNCSSFSPGTWSRGRKFRRQENGIKCFLNQPYCKQMPEKNFPFKFTPKKVKQTCQNIFYLYEKIFKNKLNLFSFLFKLSVALTLSLWKSQSLSGCKRTVDPPDTWQRCLIDLIWKECSAVRSHTSIVLLIHLLFLKKPLEMIKLCYSLDFANPHIKMYWS